MPGYTPVDFVQLPRLSASAAAALGQQMLAAAAAQEPFPASAIKSHAQLTTTHTALNAVLLEQLGQQGELSAEDEVRVRDLDRIVDNCWGGLDDRLLGLSKLPPDVPGAIQAAVLRKRLFPKGLSFLKLSYKLQWHEGKQRLDLIEQEQLAPSLVELAGAQFLPAIVKAQDDYGRALGMTAPLASGASATGVREALDAFTNALRTYIIKVTASVEDDVPATQTAADALLLPLAKWSTPAKRPKAEEPTEPAEGGASESDA